MSHYTEMKTDFHDADCLVDALVAVGIPREWIEVNKTPRPLLDYQGKTSMYRWKDHQDDRFKAGDCAHVIVRRDKFDKLNPEHRGLFNDMGFYLDTAKGSVAFVCDYSRQYTGFNDAWTNRVRQEYTVAKTKKHYKALGRQVHVERAGAKVHLYVKA